MHPTSVHPAAPVGFSLTSLSHFTFDPSFARPPHPALERGSAVHRPSAASQSLSWLVKLERNAGGDSRSMRKTPWEREERGRPGRPWRVKSRGTASRPVVSTVCIRARDPGCARREERRTRVGEGDRCYHRCTDACALRPGVPCRRKRMRCNRGAPCDKCSAKGEQDQCTGTSEPSRIYLSRT